MASTDMKVCEIVLRASVASGGAGASITNNVFHYQRSNELAAYTGTAILNAFAASIGVAYKAFAHEDCGSFILTFRNINDAIGGISEQAMAGQGAKVGARLPTYSSVCFHLKSGFRGKSQRGRKMYSPLLESETTNDLLSGAGLTAAQTLADAMLAGFNDGTSNWTPVVVSQKNSQLKTNPTTVSYIPVVAVEVQPKLGTMVRRKAG